MSEMDEWYDEDDNDDQYEYDDIDGWYDLESSCGVCGEHDVLDACQQCGTPLCSMHAELGCGFCPDHPDKHYHPDGDHYSIVERVVMFLKSRLEKRQTVSTILQDEEIPF